MEACCELLIRNLRLQKQVRTSWLSNQTCFHPLTEDSLDERSPVLLIQLEDFYLIERIISVYIQIQSLIDTILGIKAVVPPNFQFCEGC